MDEYLKVADSIHGNREVYVGAVVCMLGDKDASDIEALLRRASERERAAVKALGTAAPSCRALGDFLHENGQQGFRTAWTIAQNLEAALATLEAGNG